MQIRKNTKAFKSILEIVSACQGRSDREKLIRLYITRAGDSIRERIPVEGIQGDASLFYEMNYQAVLNSLQSSHHQLHMSDDVPGIYYFHTSSNKTWDETPFEFDPAVKDEFSSLPELPLFRKKEKADKVVLPIAKTKPEEKKGKKEKAEKGKPKKQKPEKKTTTRAPEPEQPRFKLRHKIIFEDLDKVIFRQPRLTRKDVLDYYNGIADYILPYLKDRPVVIDVPAQIGRNASYASLEALREKHEDEIPDWMESDQPGKNDDAMLLCNDREHLLWYASIGGVQFNAGSAKMKAIDAPDLLAISISTDAEFLRVIDVALGLRKVLEGLRLPSFVKTDGSGGLHVCIPLDAGSEFAGARSAAEFICRLVKLKMPDVVSLHGDEHTYGKVIVDLTLTDADRSVVAPYSLLLGESATVATPLSWDEVTDDLRPEDFNHESIFKKLKRDGDPFRNLFKKRINADELVTRMEDAYGFLF